MNVKWEVEFHKDFDPEFDALPDCPQLGRPRADTLKGSRHANMKEFDRRRSAVLLIAGDKSGGGEKRFYRRLIAKADERFDEHLLRTKGT